MRREGMWRRLRERREPWDMVVIGGGATGLGVAVDAASRGYDAALFEQSDFGQGTSSRSTKLVHGGVRYLQQGDVSLVMEALRERGRLRDNAPHLVHELPFIVPSYRWRDSWFYGIGLKVYDLLARRYRFGKSTHVSRAGVLESIPTIQRDKLRGGTRYFDGQFDDARLAITLAQTAADHGAVVLNYAPVRGLLKDGLGRTRGVRIEDAETTEILETPAKVVVNATGVFVDSVRRMDDGAVPPMVTPSQGAHVVLDRQFLPGDTALMVPRTDDGRVMFAIPWQGVTVVGTTDTPIDATPLEPRALPEEVDFILDTAGRYLAERPTRRDVRSVFVGVRPLVKAGATGNTAKLSRDHTVTIDDRSGLVTVAGGKWTTYRHMAEDVVDQAAGVAALPTRACVTEDLRLHGALAEALTDRNGNDPLSVYGSDAAALRAMTAEDSSLGEPLHPALPITAAQVRWACEHEMTRRVEDVLSRRTRCLIYDAAAATEAAPAVARVMAECLGHDAAWERDQTESFAALAEGYRCPPAAD